MMILVLHNLSKKQKKNSSRFFFNVMIKNVDGCAQQEPCTSENICLQFNIICGYINKNKKRWIELFFDELLNKQKKHSQF